MNRSYPQPTIIGTDLTGLLISIALSNAEIEHLLIGNAPTDESLHHGETSNMVAPIIFLQAFPELKHCVYEKKWGIAHAGKYSSKLDFSHPSLLPMKYGLKFFEQIDYTYPLQIDRVALDQALFEKATDAPYCTHIDTSIIGAIDYDAATDRIRQVHLADGTAVATSHLFDASAQECVIGQQIGLPTRQLDEPYFMVQAYYHVDRPLTKLRQMGWCDELNILRLYQHEWGVDGIATLIPLGDRLSVRVSAPLRQLSTEPVAEELLEIAERALYQVGIPYRDLFPHQAQVHSEVNQQYVHERAYGANWLLTGMAYCNTLVTTAISADTAFEAFHVGLGFLKKPEQMGKDYQHYMDYYLKMHESWQQLACHDPAIATAEWIQAMTDQYVWANGMQQHQGYVLQQFDNPLHRAVDLTRTIAEMITLPRFAAPFSSIQRRGSILD